MYKRQARTKKVSDIATKKQTNKLGQAAKDITQQRDNLIVKREKLRSVTGNKDVKSIRLTNRKVGDLDKLAQTTKKAASGVGNPNAPVKYNKMTQGADFIKKNRVSNKSGSQVFNQNTIKNAKGPSRSKDVELPKDTFTKKGTKVTSKMGGNPAKTIIPQLSKRGFKLSLIHI